MKKHLFLLLTMFLISAPVTQYYAEDNEVYESGDYTYFINDDGTATISKWTGSDTDLTIPEEIDGYTVTKIGDKAFSICLTLTNIEIPDTVTSIGKDAFQVCGFSGFEFPDSLVSIGDGAFYGCINLKSIEIPDTVTSIGMMAFSACTSLEDIKVSQNNERYEVIDHVLFDKSEKTLLAYPAGREESSYSIPDETLIIGDLAFADCTALNNIIIPDSVNRIGSSAFSECFNLSGIEIPASVTAIENNTFYFCESLTNIEIPDSVKSIGDYAFNRCKSLNTVVIPDAVHSIGVDTFANCDSVTLVVGKDSYALKYAINNGINYEYPDEIADEGLVEQTQNTQILFRGYDWGTSYDVVFENEITSQNLAEGIEYIAEDNSIFRFYDDVAGYKMSAIYTFKDGGLFTGIYRLIEDHSNLTQYYYDFQDLADKFTILYGEPSRIEEIWLDDLYKDDPSDWGMSFATGRTVYRDTWTDDFGNTLILMIRGDNHEITVAMGYYCSTYEAIPNTNGL